MQRPHRGIADRVRDRVVVVGQPPRRPAVDHPDGGQLPPCDVRVGAPLALVGRVDQGGQDDAVEADRGDAADDVRLEDRGVQDVRAQVAEQPPHRPHPPDPPRRADEPDVEARGFHPGLDPFVTLEKADHGRRHSLVP